MGTVASYSFYPGKNLGAMGDAGALCTNDQALADRMGMFARHGGLVKGDHQIEGINSRLDGLQAAVLSVKLPHLRAWTARRQEIARRYAELLAGVSGVTVPFTAANREHVYHLFVIRHEKRDALARHLQAQGVQTVVNYPVALPFLPCYQRLGHKSGDFPNAFHNQSRVLSLPMFPEMSAAQLEHVARALSAFRA
jgi:dTDP-4-amino-4,6-dideoxygalactose transaminase